MRLVVRCFLFVAAGLLARTAAVSPAEAKPSAEQVANQVDKLLTEEVFSEETQLVPRVSDATFLRRVWLDIVGDIPTPEHVTAFLLDPAPDKRQRVVRELLDDPQYGQNWARYWRDVLHKLRFDRPIDATDAVLRSVCVKHAGPAWRVGVHDRLRRGGLWRLGQIRFNRRNDMRTLEMTTRRA